LIEGYHGGSYFVLDGGPDLPSERATSLKVGVLVGEFLGHRLGDDLVDWNSGVSVRTSVRPQKVFPISI